MLTPLLVALLLAAADSPGAATAAVQDVNCYGWISRFDRDSAGAAVRAANNDLQHKARPKAGSFRAGLRLDLDRQTYVAFADEAHGKRAMSGDIWLMEPGRLGLKGLDADCLRAAKSCVSTEQWAYYPALHALEIVRHSNGLEGVAGWNVQLLDCRDRRANLGSAV